MSGNRLVLDGFAELREALRSLPADLAREAANVVTAAANGAAAEIKAAYPVRTGKLRARLDVVHGNAGTYGAAAVVKNTAPHAALFDRGTQARHTDIGANRGSMPPGRVFVPRVIRHRRRMYERLAEMVERHGLTVTGRE